VKRSGFDQPSESPENPWSQPLEHYKMATRALEREMSQGNWEIALSVLDERQKAIEELDALFRRGMKPPSAVGTVVELMEKERRLVDLAMEARRRLVAEMEGLSAMARWARGVRDTFHEPKAVGRLEISG